MSDPADTFQPLSREELENYPYIPSDRRLVISALYHLARVEELERERPTIARLREERNYYKRRTFELSLREADAELELKDWRWKRDEALAHIMELEQKLKDAESRP
jgi:hypothetical protein